MQYIPGGISELGGRDGESSPDELPAHPVKISSFYMDETEVTNEQFNLFVKATGYVTVAERALDWEKLKEQLPPGTPKPPDSLLAPGSLIFKMTEGPVPLDQYDQWWRWQVGANWRHPEGPVSDLKDKWDHPVVHVAKEDAEAYAKWMGKRLPTEAEWEYAAGLDQDKYPWGNIPVAQAYEKANFWQGLFPYKNDKLDGYEGTSPVRSFPANAYGLYDMAGNVWEWCSDRYHAQAYSELNGAKIIENPAGPLTSFDPSEPYNSEKYVIRGGSFLCNDSYCSGYRIKRRMSSDRNTSFNHTGFRCVQDIQE